MKRTSLFRAALPLIMVGLGLTVVLSSLWLSAPRPAFGAESPGETGTPKTVSSPDSPTIIQGGSPFTIPKGTSATLDGNCFSSQGEYGDARIVEFADANNYTATARLKHDNQNIYVCVLVQADPYAYGSQVAVYLDYELGQEPLAQFDDLKLEVNMFNYTATYRGTGSGGYTSVALMNWGGRAFQSVGSPIGSAEYSIPINIAIAGGLCHNKFGLAVYHHVPNPQGAPQDFGWPSAQYPNQPNTWYITLLDNAMCTPKLPIFHLLPVTVTDQTAAGLAGLFSGLGGQPVFSDTSHSGTPRFNVPNTTTGSLLEQYGASGGFFAFNASGAFSTTERGQLDPNEVKRQACQFLSSHDLFPPQTRPDAQPPCSDRVGDLPYQVTGIFAGMQPSGTTSLAETEIVTTGVLVQIPLGIDPGSGNPLPLQGPGGHLSLIVVTTTQQVAQDVSAPGQLPLLDASMPGLAALAIPFSRTLESRGNYTVTEPSQAVQALRARTPGVALATSDPELVYYADDAAEPQQNLIPTWYFGVVTTTVDGHQVTLRGTSVPAVEGFLPIVEIISPANGTVFVPNRPLTLTGNISGGAGPYTFTWRVEGGDSVTGTTAGGLVSLVRSIVVPVHEGGSAPVSVRLHATDSNGATSEDNISLQQGPMVYLPIVLRNAPGQASLVLSVEAINSPAAPMAFGIEAGWDYPPYGPGGSDLPGVIPDAFGFRTGMLGQGWTQRFFWANANAWEKDWRDCSLGGLDCTFGVDRADFVYYPGHGGPGGLSVPSNNHDSGWAAGANMRFQNARWIGFASCATLRAQGYSPASSAPIFTEFHNSFRGSHMLLGFNTSMADVAFGPRLVDNMRVPTWLGIPFIWAQHTIAEAWVLTAFEMNAGKPAYIWVIGSNGYNPYFDKLPGVYTPSPWGRPYPFTSWNWVWWDG